MTDPKSRLHRALELSDAEQELTRVKADNERLAVDAAGVDAAARALADMQRKLEENLRQPAALTAAERDRCRSKYHAARREVRRLNAVVRMAGLLQRSQARNAIDRANEMGELRRSYGDKLAALTEAERTIAELKTDIAWERGWDLCRKAQMGAVVEAARAFVAAPPSDAASLRYADLVAALSALDRPDSEEQTAKEWYHPSPVEQHREIKLHSTWRRKYDGEVGEVWRVYPDGGRVGWADSGGYGNTYEVAVFRERFEWVSDSVEPVVGSG